MHRLTARPLPRFALFLIALTLGAHAQTYTVIHNFTGGADGANPIAGLTMDRAGNLYGTTFAGGGGSCTNTYEGTGCGAVFKLTRAGAGWTLAPLYDFHGVFDGAGPWSGVVFGQDGRLYGTATAGGMNRCDPFLNLNGCGVVYSLTPPARTCSRTSCVWREVPIYSFFSELEESNPLGSVVFDAAGNLYGTTIYGNNFVYKLTPNHGGWLESTLYDFDYIRDGNYPVAGVTFDNQGNLYGTTSSGGTIGWGTVFQLSPSGEGWTENTLHYFQGGDDGGAPWAGLTLDQHGNLFGATSCGTVFELTPSGGGWSYSDLYDFNFDGCGEGPNGNLILDAAGNIYGTTWVSVFKLTPSNGSWSYSSLHDFGNGMGGSTPYGGLVFDANGNLYGTAYYGGTGTACPSGCGVVFEITP